MENNRELHQYASNHLKWKIFKILSYQNLLSFSGLSCKLFLAIQKWVIDLMVMNFQWTWLRGAPCQSHKVAGSSQLNLFGKRKKIKWENLALLFIQEGDLIGWLISHLSAQIKGLWAHFSLIKHTLDIKCKENLCMFVCIMEMVHVIGWKSSGWEDFTGNNEVLQKHQMNNNSLVRNVVRFMNNIQIWKIKGIVHHDRVHFANGLDHWTVSLTCKGPNGVELYIFLGRRMVGLFTDKKNGIAPTMHLPEDFKFDNFIPMWPCFYCWQILMNAKKKELVSVLSAAARTPGVALSALVAVTFCTSRTMTPV